MSRLHRFPRQGSLQIAAVVLAVSSWLSGCGDDEEGDAGTGAKGGSAGTAGNAGSGTGGSAGSGTGGTSGTSTGGAGGMTGGSGGMTGGSGGMTGGSAGSAGSGMGGEGMGGEGMGGEGATGGVGAEGGMGAVGGEGGSPEMMCLAANLSLTPFMNNQAHDHVPTGAELTPLVNMINTGMPLVFTLPEDGTNPHTHTLTFTAMQLTVLRNGGILTGMNRPESSTGGPTGNMHEHTYTIECQP